MSHRGCIETRKGNVAAILSFGRHRDKPGVGYTCSLQAMSCVSRATPDLHHAATRAAQLCSRFSCLIGARGVRGEALSFALTFTCHFCLRQTRHWGDVTRECPRRLCARGSMTLRRAKAALLSRKSTKKPQPITEYYDTASPPGANTPGGLYHYFSSRKPCISTEPSSWRSMPLNSRDTKPSAVLCCPLALTLEAPSQ